MRNKKAAIGAVFLYLLMTFGTKMFFSSYVNSYNRLNTDKLVPFTAEIDGETIKFTIAGNKYTIDSGRYSADKKGWLGAYILTSDEFRLSGIILNSLKDELLSVAKAEIFT